MQYQPKREYDARRAINSDVMLVAKLIGFVLSSNSQRIVTGGETVDDTYIGHVMLPSHLIIASKQCLWAIDTDSRDPWCISWAEISHYSIDAGNCLTITVFTSQGQQSYVFNMSSAELAKFDALLSMQKQKMVCARICDQLVKTCV